MKEVWNLLSHFYSAWLHPTFVSLVAFFVNNQYGLYFLLAGLVVLLIVKRRIGNLSLRKTINFVTTIIIIFLIVVAYDSFSPTFFNYLKRFSNSSSTSQTKTSSPTKSSSGTQSTPTKQSTPSYQPEKRLYYSVSCSNCWNENCVHTGYSYGGYDVGYYNYYRNICQSCSCNDYKSQSFWK